MLKILVQIVIGLVAIEHLYIMYFEMFAWETIGKKTFKSLAAELFKPTKQMAANQGLYNGFLASGLIWSFFIRDEVWSQNIAIFFLSCVITAGIYGGLTVTKKIFFIQAVPAIIGLVLLLLT